MNHPAGKRAISKVAELIFGKLGKGCAVQNQHELRRLVQVSATALTNLRNCPEKISNEVLIKFAHAVSLDANKVLEAAGRKLNQEEVQALQEKQTGSRNTIENTVLSGEELQILIELEKLIKGPVPLKYGIELINLRRQNCKTGN